MKKLFLIILALLAMSFVVGELPTQNEAYAGGRKIYTCISTCRSSSSIKSVKTDVCSMNSESAKYLAKPKICNCTGDKNLIQECYDKMTCEDFKKGGC